MLLAIDTSQMNYSIAFSNGNETKWDDIHTTLYDQLKATSLDEIEGIIVNIGPGRFSGLRSGLSFAQGLSLAKNLPIYPITQFELMASKIKDTEFSIILDARKNEVYLQQYRSHIAHGNIIISADIPNIDNLYGNIKPAKILDTSAIDLITYFKQHIITPIKPQELCPVYIRPSV